MLYAVDIIRKGEEHRTTNHPTLSALLESGQLRRVWLSDSSSARDIVKQSENVALNCVRVSSGGFYRWIKSTFITLKILITSLKESADIFFMSATPLHYFLVMLISTISNKPVQYYIVMHGELGYLNSSDGLGQKIGAILIRMSFGLAKVGRVKFITLGFPIYKQLAHRFPRLAENLVDFEHPSLQVEYTRDAYNSGLKIRIASFGVHCSDKLSHYIYILAEKLRKNSFDKIELLTIGVAHTDFLYNQNESIRHLCTGTTGRNLIPTDIFLSEVLTLDWALIFQGHSKKYELIPSGVFYDCINYGIPIVALHSNSLDSYFEKYGSLGVLCNSVEEMALIIQKIASGELHVVEFKVNLQKARDDISFSKYRRRIFELIK